MATDQGRAAARWIGLAGMRSDLATVGYDEMTRWEKTSMWLRFYWWPTRGWLPKVESWWLYNVRRYPPPPPLDEDPVYQRLRDEGFFDA